MKKRKQQSCCLLSQIKRSFSIKQKVMALLSEKRKKEATNLDVINTPIKQFIMSLQSLLSQIKRSREMIFSKILRTGCISMSNRFRTTTEYIFKPIQSITLEKSLLRSPKKLEIHTNCALDLLITVRNSRRHR